MQQKIKNLLAAILLLAKRKPKPVGVTNDLITYEGATFERAFARLTGREFRLWMNANGATVAQPPEDMTAEGALTWWEYGDGVGAYDENDKYFATGMDDTRAYQWREDAETSWDSDAAAFVNLCVGNDTDRALEVIRPERTRDYTPITTQINLWNVPDYQTALSSYPLLNARGNWIQPVDVYYGLGTDDPETVDAELVADLLDAQPEGRRWLRATTYNSGSHYLFDPGSGSTRKRGSLLNIYSATSGRMCLFDAEMTHATRVGISMEDTVAAITATDSPLRTFLQELKAIAEARYGVGNAPQLVNGVYADEERRRWFFYWQRGFETLDSPTAISINTTSNVCTAVAHGFATGDCGVVTLSSGSSYPAPFTVNTTGNVAFVRKATDDTFTLHTTLAGARANTGTIDFTTTGANVQFTRKTETLEHVILDDEHWETMRTEVLLPEISENDWKAGINQWDTPWDYATDHRVFASADAAHRTYYTGKLAEIMAVFKEELGEDVDTHEYSCCRYATATHCPGYPQSDESHPFGAGYNAGGGTQAIYGAPNAPRFYWPTEGLQTASTEWSKFVLEIVKLRNAFSATNWRLEHDHQEWFPWLSHANWVTGGANGSPLTNLYYEMNLHVLLTCEQCNFYVGSNDTSKSLGHEMFRRCVDEVDAVRVYRPYSMELHPPLADTDPAYMATQVWCGARHVWRVTPKLGTSATVVEQNGSVVFTFADASTLTITRANLVSYSSVSSYGYWVEEFPPNRDAGNAITSRRRA